MRSAEQHLREWQQPVADAVTEPPSKQVGSKGEIGAARAANIRGVLRADLPDRRPGPGQVVGHPAVAAVQVDASASAWRRVGAHVVVVAADFEPAGVFLGRRWRGKNAGESRQEHRDERTANARCARLVVVMTSTLHIPPPDSPRRVHLDTTMVTVVDACKFPLVPVMVMT